MPNSTNRAPTLSIGNLPSIGLGVRAETPQDLAAFEALTGVPAAGVLGFGDQATPAISLDRVTTDAQTFAAMQRPVNWAIPLSWPGISMASVASGSQDEALLAIARTIAEHQTVDINPELFIRLGWEPTNAYPWRIFSGPDKALDEKLAADYVAAFQHVATLFRSVDDRFRIEWNQNYANKDANGVFYDLEKIYPGDEFVDVVGVDAYNVARFSGQDDPVSAWWYKLNAPYGLNWFSEFAAAHGKPLALTEWGINSDGFGHYVEKLAVFVRTNNVLYTNYWNADARSNGDDTVTDGSKPATAAAIASAFGPESSSYLIPGRQSGPIVEAGWASGSGPLAGTATASMWAVKGDPDAGDIASFDAAGWSRIDATHLAKNGLYGSVVLDTATGVLNYTLDNARAATNALADGASVTDVFSVTVRDTSGASITRDASFTVAGAWDALETRGLVVTGAVADFLSQDRIVTFDTPAAAMDQVSIKLANGGLLDLGSQLDGTRPAKIVASQNATTIVSAAGDDELYGGASGDVLKGMGGNDRLDGRGGADSMYGGPGNDLFYVDSAGDRVIELANEGIDTVRTGYTHTLGANLENLELIWSGNAWGTGNALDNRLVGNSGDNTLKGLAGNDTLDGRGGVDSLYGGMGNDLYYVDDGGDRVVELSGQGVDTVRTGYTHTLADNVEDLELIWSGNAWGTGNALDNRLVGNSGNNTLKGLAGDDTIHGGGGSDRIAGGPGNDVLDGGAGSDSFIFDAPLDSGANVDLVLDFDPAADRILLDQSVFAGIGPGELAAAAFVIGQAAVTGANRIVYDSDAGDLFYDPDGSGAADQFHFATLAPHLALSPDDFTIV